MTRSGYVKNYRKIEDWKFYKKDGYAHLWQHIIRKATHKEVYDGYGNLLKPGQFSTGRKRLSDELGISESKVQRILQTLEIEQQIEQQAFNNCRIITIVNWEDYQVSDSDSNNNRTTDEHPANIQRTQNKNAKNNKKYIYSKKFEEIIEYLNQKAGKKFKHTTATYQKHMAARLNEGYDVEDFKTVIENKYQDYLSGKFNHNYLRPSTLFAGKFDEYLNEVKETTQPNKTLDFLSKQAASWGSDE